MSEIKRTPLYDAHIAAGAKLIPFAGYEMPVRYTGDVAEHLLVREKAGLFDVSHMGEFLVRGPQALPLLQFVTSNDVSTIPIGKAQYNCLPNANGGVVDDLIVYRLEEELYLLVVNAANIAKDWAWISEQNARFNAKLEDISPQTALIAVSGPKAADCLRPLTDAPVDSMEYYAICRGAIDLPEKRIENVLFATTGYTGEKTFEIFLRNEDALAVWNALLKHGEPFGAQPTGLGARDTLRLEMGYMLYGNDLTDEISPLEAGLAWITKLNKGEFMSGDIFRAQKAAGLKRKLVAFSMTEKGGVPRGHCPIAKDGKIIGEVTSGTFSPILKNGIGMGYVDAEFAAQNTEIDIMIRDKAVKAKVVKTPFVAPTSLTGWTKKNA